MADRPTNDMIESGASQMEKPHHYTYLRDFRTKQCPEFLLHKCTQHRPFTCFNWHFSNQKRRRPTKRRDGTFNYSSDNYCSKYDETTGICPDGDECPCLHRTAGDTERRYHLRYYKTCPCVYETDSKGHCVKNGLHCAFAHGPQDLRKPVYDIREVQAAESGEMLGIAESPLTNSLETDRLLNENPVWNDPLHVLIHYKTEFCNRPLRLCRQGYACPSYHNPRDKRRSPAQFKYRSTPCPNVKQADEWGDPSKCDSGDNCGYCHTRTEQQFHLEIYKSTKCNDMIQTGYCPRGLFCAFAHAEHEMNVKWDVSVANYRMPPSSFAKNSLNNLALGNKQDDLDNVDLGLGSTCLSTASKFDGDRPIGNIFSMPRKHSLIDYGDLTRQDEPDRFRQSTMSVGSYQQFQQLQQNRANKRLQYTNFATSNPNVSGYFPSSEPAPTNPLPSLVFSAVPKQLPSHQVLQTSVPQVLPPSFFTRGGQSEDDLDLNLSDLNSVLDQEFQKDPGVDPLNLCYNNGLSLPSTLHLTSGLPAMLPVQTNDSMSKQLRAQPMGSTLGNFTPNVFTSQQIQPHTHVETDLQRHEVCEAWKKESEKQESLLKQAQEERDFAVKMRDNVLSKVAEMKHEISLLSGGNPNPVLHCLQQDVNFQQMPLAALQQIHTTLQHNYSLLEQKLTEMGLCCMCKERPNTVLLHPCNHCVLCFICSSRMTECPTCGTFIEQRSSLPVRFQ